MVGADEEVWPLVDFGDEVTEPEVDAVWVVIVPVPVADAFTVLALVDAMFSDGLPVKVVSDTWMMVCARPALMVNAPLSLLFEEQSHFPSLKSPAQQNRSFPQAANPPLRFSLSIARKKGDG